MKYFDQSNHCNFKWTYITYHRSEAAFIGKRINVKTGQIVFKTLQLRQSHYLHFMLTSKTSLLSIKSFDFLIMIIPWTVLAIRSHASLSLALNSGIIVHSVKSVQVLKSRLKLISPETYFLHQLFQCLLGFPSWVLTRLILKVCLHNDFRLSTTIEWTMAL